MTKKTPAKWRRSHKMYFLFISKDVSDNGVDEIGELDIELNKIEKES